MIKEFSTPNGFRRDASSRALINTDVKELERYRREKAKETRLVHLENLVKELAQALNNLAANVDRIMERNG